MEQMVLRKRLSTFKSAKGRFGRVSDELLLDILRAWEHWQGSKREFYEGLGVSKMQIGFLIREGKKAAKRHVSGTHGFQQIDILEPTPATVSSPGTYTVELCWDGNKTARFRTVDQLLEFIKKAA